MDSIFLNLLRGNRQSQYMGFKLPEGQLPKYGPAYSYIEVPLDSTTGSKILRNQHVFLVPMCKVHVRGDYHLLVEPNPALAEWGSVQAPYWIHANEGEKVPGFWITPRKDLDLDSVEYAVRLYLQV